VNTQADAMTSIRLLLEAVDHKASTLPDHVHPAWIDAAWARLGPKGTEWAARVPAQRHSALLAKAFGLVWPSLAVFREPGHRIALLDRDSMLRVLAVCALDGRGESVRRSVGRVVRQLLIEGIGENAYEKVLGNQVRGLQPPSNPLGPFEVGQERLAADGFRALCAQAAWRNRSLITLVRLSLPPSARGEHVQVNERPAGSAIKGVDRMIDRLHEYFPELAWLFGSDMDRALSV